MSLDGIDISNWQSDIDAGAVAGDFVICKATEGTGYVSPSCDKQYQAAKKAGKKLGAYHYANGGDYKAEADFFIKNVKGYIGEAILVLDWESQGNPKFNSGQDKAWVKGWCDYVHQQTGVKPLVYISAGYRDLVSGIGDYGLWIAQYADNDATGYQDAPWNEGAYSCAIRQYSSHGRISGYGGNLDLNKFYGDCAAWDKYANPGGAKQPETPAQKPAPQAPKPSRRQVAVDGLWGRETTLALQEHYGLYAGGIVSGQNSSFKGISAGCLYGSFEWVPGGGSGSPTIRALQRTVGAVADGFVGPDTWRALIAYGMARGSGAAYNDARLDAPSVTIGWLQRALNAGTL
jgi:GH25 family lysozyme M1 (1,4-beta-N-acetylmuramidase)